MIILFQYNPCIFAGFSCGPFCYCHNLLIYLPPGLYVKTMWRPALLHSLSRAQLDLGR